jgi:tyrosyl-tRNA synthetase
MVSPYKFHQFWLNTPDSDVVKLLKLFTLKTKEEISELEQSMAQSPETRPAQRALADAVCTLVHGEHATQEAVKSAEALFGGSLEGLSSDQLLDLFSEAPTTQVSRDEASSMDLLSLLAKTVAKSKGEARRLLSGGGIYVDNCRTTEESLKIADTNLTKTGLLILRSGKKNYHVVKMQQE